MPEIAPHAPGGGEPPELRREMTAVGGGLFGAGGALVLLVLVFSSWPGIRPPVLAATSSVALVAGALLLVLARVRPLPVNALAGLALLGTANITTTIIGAGPEGAGPFGVLYVFVTVFSFYYFALPMALAQVVLTAGTYAVALSVVGVSDPVAQWIVVTGANVIIAVLIGRGGKRVRDLLVAEQQGAQRLRELDDLRTAFLRAVSHELRTPLTTVVGNAETLQRYRHQMDDERIDLLISKIQVNGERLERLLSNLLDIDRISRGVVEAQRERVDLGQLTRKIVDDLRRPSHQIRVETQDQTMIAVEASKVERIVENLVSNAMRHTPEGTAINVHVRDVGSGVEISVTDDGPGVPPELVERIFEPFEQGASAATSPTPGTGIGLSLVAKFAELHGGRAWVEPSPTGGAGFHVHLPRVSPTTDEALSVSA